MSTKIWPRPARAALRLLEGAGRAHQPRRILLASSSKPSRPKDAQPSSRQAVPLGPYYETILNNPTPYSSDKPEAPPASSNPEPEPAQVPPPAPTKSPRGRKPKDPSAPRKTTGKKPPAASAAPPPSPATSPPEPTPPSSNAAEKARIVFGSRLAGPAERAERLAELRAASKLIAGVLVPPRPEEPDNCCMSGCVNCVWDRFRDDMEEWAAASTEADRRLQSQGRQRPAARQIDPARGSAALSMDDDGGGSEANWDPGAVLMDKKEARIAKDLWDEELYRNVPVGIREFMKQEKRLKEKHMREGTLGG